MLAYSINMGIAPIPMILGGYLVDRRQARWVALAGGVFLSGGWMLAGHATSALQLQLAYGVLAGLGQGLCYSAGVSNTLKLFPDRRGLAAGILTGVNGGATILVAPIASTLADRDVGAMMMIIGGVFGVLTVVASLFIRPAAATTNQSRARTASWASVSPSQMVRTPAFWMAFGCLVCGAFSGVMIAGNAKSIAIGMYGLAPAVAVGFVSVYSAANMSGRFIFGPLSDRIGQMRSLTVVFTAIVASLLALVLGKGMVPALAVGLIGLGICYGGIMGVMPALILALFGPEHQGVNYGLVFAAYSVSSLIAPGMAATLGSQHGGDYTAAFLIAIGAASLGLAVVLLFQRSARSRATERTEPALVLTTSES